MTALRTTRSWLVCVTAGLLCFAGCASGQLLPEEPGQAEQPDAPATTPANGPARGPELPDPEVVSLLSEIEAAAADLATLRGRVRYTVEQGVLGDRQQRFGDLYYATPDEDAPTRFAIHFDRLIVDDRARPINRRYIFDGHWLLEENHDDMNATRRELVPPGQASDDVLRLGGNQVPIPLQLKADQVLADYQVARLPDAELGEMTLIHLRLTPREAVGDESAEPLDLWFDSETMMLTKVRHRDADDTVEVLLSLVRPNTEIDAETFDTDLPPARDGWQVQEVPLD